MKTVHATASFGFYGAEHEEDFEFEDEATEDDIYVEIWEWATSFVNVGFEIEESED